jgi:hypothetical protein
MDEKDRKRFGQAMVLMAECFQKEPSKMLVQGYWRILQDMTIETFEKACLVLVNTRKITGTFPMVAEIREAAGGGAGAQALRAVVAWDKFMYALHRHAPYDSVKFNDPIITHIVRQLGGWIEMGDWPAEETKWKRKEFERLYEAYSAGDLPETNDHLVGLVEAENRAKFPDFVPKPFLITDDPTTGTFKSLPWEPPVNPDYIIMGTSLVEG